MTEKTKETKRKAEAKEEAKQIAEEMNVEAYQEERAAYEEERW